MRQTLELPGWKLEWVEVPAGSRQSIRKTIDVEVIGTKRYDTHFWLSIDEHSTNIAQPDQKKHQISLATCIPVRYVALIVNRWWFGLVVTSLVTSTKLLYIEPG